MTKKWLSQTPYPPRIPEFYTLTKIHKSTLVGRQIISGCNGPTEGISAFVDTLLQPISTSQAPYLKDSTDFINFIEKVLLEKWHSIQNQPSLRQIFKEPLLISFKRGKSLKDVLVRAKVYRGQRPKNTIQ